METFLIRGMHAEEEKGKKKNDPSFWRRLQMSRHHSPICKMQRRTAKNKTANKKRQIERSDLLLRSYESFFATVLFFKKKPPRGCFE